MVSASEVNSGKPTTTPRATSEAAALAARVGPRRAAASEVGAGERGSDDRAAEGDEPRVEVLHGERGSRAART